jgi:hypothetical protein
MATLAFYALVAFWISTPFCCGHSFLAEPPSRNLVASRRGDETCPHCLQSGGPDQVASRSNHIWPTSLDPPSHGLCGDPVQGSTDPSSLATSPYLVPTPVQRTYRAGDVVEFRIGVSTHHQGHYEFRICDQGLDGSTLSSAAAGQDCLNEWVLERAELDSSCGGQDSPADCQPIDVKHPGRWYLPPVNEGTQTAGLTWNDNMATDGIGEYHVMKYKIPEALHCESCTLQWYWSTGNSCLYDGDYLGSDGYFQRNQDAFAQMGWDPEEWCTWCMKSWATCGNSCCKTGGTFAEEFWNCADIKVQAAGPVPPPTPEPPTPKPTAAPTRTCHAQVGNTQGATDARCEEACSFLSASQWPCNGLCSCS